MSHVSLYGNIKLESDDVIANVIGAKPVPPDYVCSKEGSGSVAIPDAPLHYLKWQVSHAKDAESLKAAQSNLNNYLQEEERIAELKSKTLELFASEDPKIKIHHMSGTILPTTTESRICYRDVVEHFKEHCANPMRLRGGLSIFSNACAMKMDIPKLKREMITTCETYKALVS